MMTTTRTTTADRVAALLGYDGTRFRAADGRDLDSFCRAAGGRLDRDPAGSRYAWRFDDDSGIVVLPRFLSDRWDYQRDPRCWCWRGGDHDQEHAPTCGLASARVVAEQAAE